MKYLYFILLLLFSVNSNAKSGDVVPNSDLPAGFQKNDLGFVPDGRVQLDSDVQSPTSKGQLVHNQVKKLAPEQPLAELFQTIGCYLCSTAVTVFLFVAMFTAIKRSLPTLKVMFPIFVALSIPVALVVGLWWLFTMPMIISLPTTFGGWFLLFLIVDSMGPRRYP